MASFSLNFSANEKPSFWSHKFFSQSESLYKSSIPKGFKNLGGVSHLNFFYLSALGQDIASFSFNFSANEKPNFRSHDFLSQSEASNLYKGSILNVFQELGGVSFLKFFDSSALGKDMASFSLNVSANEKPSLNHMTT